jgi:fermentation-respiration switch protein FrsA (DUF1100 family)
MKKQAAIAGMTGLLGLGGARLLEQKMLFPVPVLSRERLSRLAANQQAQEISLEAEDGTRLYGWYRQGQGPRKAVFLWFDGNATAIGSRPLEHQKLQEAGFDTVWISYRGYPGSEGSPTEAGLKMDARAAWNFSAKLQLPVVLYGKSLGGGVAAALAGDPAISGAPAALIVESSFTSVSEVAEKLFWGLPVGYLLLNRFDTLGFVLQHQPHYQQIPSLVLHGTEDSLIPVDHGKRLSEALGGKFWPEHGADHNAAIFLDRLDTVLSWVEAVVSKPNPL